MVGVRFSFFVTRRSNSRVPLCVAKHLLRKAGVLSPGTRHVGAPRSRIAAGDYLAFAVANQGQTWPLHMLVSRIAMNVQQCLRLEFVRQILQRATRTIMENIRYGRPDATDEEVIEAAKTAHADHFIRTHPHGYEMVINEEANNISQGQMQLLTIARAVLADPEMLILDEATSSVDTRTELLIQKAMDVLMKNRTSFIIAHRLSTIRNADLILVMNEGDIVEQGTHTELLAKNGFYADLYNSQFDVTKAG